MYIYVLRLVIITCLYKKLITDYNKFTVINKSALVFGYSRKDANYS